MSIIWLQPWAPVALSQEQTKLQDELHLELGAGHPLFGLRTVVLAKRRDQDDVLFELEDGSVAEVHLTWRGYRESNPRWPRTIIYPSASAWAEDRMRPLYQEFTLGS